MSDQCVNTSTVLKDLPLKEVSKRLRALHSIGDSFISAGLPVPEHHTKLIEEVEIVFKEKKLEDLLIGDK